ncbi:MAG: ribosomal protein L7/L12 [Candidatus Shikimatogenerans sp. Tmey]
MSKKIKKIAKKILKLNVLEIQKILNIFKNKYNLNFENINNNFNKNIINNDEIKKDNNIKIIKNDKKYKLIIKNFGNSKLSTIKLIKDVTNLSLMESKKIVDNVPSIIKENLSLDDIKILENKFKNLNVDTEIK